MEALREKIRTVPDFPKPGILFYDITTLLRDRDGFKMTLDALADPFRDRPVDLVVGIESRGFILAAGVADRLGVGFVPIRKPKKLPSATISESFQLEYGTDSIEIHQDAIAPGQRVLLVDDVLATGGTARAAATLVKRLGGTLVAAAFLIELGFLDGRSKLAGEELHVVLRY